MATEVGDDTAHLPENTLLAIQLEGNDIKLGTVSAGTVCRYVDAFRLGLQAAIEIVESVKSTQAAGRRKRWVERMADLPLMGIEHGCLRILLGAPRQDGLFAEAEQESFTRAIDLMFQGIASAAAAEGLSAEEPVLPPAAELILLRIIARLMPPKRGSLSRITFIRRVDSNGDPLASITLDRRSRERIEARLGQQLDKESTTRVKGTTHGNATKRPTDCEPESEHALPPSLFR